MYMHDSPVFPIPATRDGPEATKGLSKLEYFTGIALTSLLQDLQGSDPKDIADKIQQAKVIAFCTLEALRE